MCEAGMKSSRALLAQFRSRRFLSNDPAWRAAFVRRTVSHGAGYDRKILRQSRTELSLPCVKPFISQEIWIESSLARA
jgi:hypothetical protein